MPSAKIPFRRAFPWLIADAAAAMAYDTWIGPVYLSAWAGKIGVPPDRLPWLTALPLLGSVGQLLGFVALARFSQSLPIKWLCIALATLARSIWALAFLLPLSDLQNLVGGVGLIAALSSMIGLTSTSLWMAWMNGIVPKRFDGRFWGARARGSTAGVLLAHFVAGWILSNDSSEPSAPFALLLALAILAAVTSLITLIFVKPPEAQTVIQSEEASGAPPIPFRRLAEPPLLGILGIGAAFQAGIALAGPYFPYYFTHEVGLSATEVSFWYAMTQLGIASAALYWGKRWDHAYSSSNANGPELRRGMFRLCAVMIALSPLPYVIRDASILRWIGPAEYFINGFAWAGFSVGLNTLLFRAVPGRDAGLTALLFSALTALQGISGALASMLGARISVWMGFQSLWVIATAFRLLVALVLIPRLGSQKKAGLLAEPAVPRGWST